MQPPLHDSVASSLQALDKITAATEPAESLICEQNPAVPDIHETDWEDAIAAEKAQSTVHAHKHERICRWIQVVTIPAVFIIVIVWLICTQGIVICVGLKYLDLSETVMVAYLTTTTVNVIGMLYVILKWLYHTPSK